MLKRKLKKAAVIILGYTLITGGTWMFINSYANSFNRLSERKIIPASITIGGEKATIEVLDKTAYIDMRGFSSGNKKYGAAYITAPDEIRLAAYLISLAYGS